MKSSIPNKNKNVKGFTLIEFLVASSLALIVILAAGSTYFFTRRLNDTTQTRVDKQNALRNAATAISRDARVAGTFGCFVTGGAVADVGAAAQTQVANSGHFPEFTAGGAHVRFDNNDPEGYGVAVVPRDDADDLVGTTAGVTFQSDMLVFVYGKGNSSVVTTPGAGGTLIVDSNRSSDPDVRRGRGAGGEMVLSSCRDAFSSLAASSGGVNNYNYSHGGRIAAEQHGELSESAMYGVGYVLAQVNGITSLLRYETGANGRWNSDNPQLLVSGVSNMNYSFAYANGCDIAASHAGRGPMGGVQFDASAILNQRNLPALIQITVDYETGLPPYVINANVRGGNACANVGKTE